MNILPTALPLTPDACPDASSRRLALEISADRIAVLVPGVDAEASAISARIALADAPGIKAVEEAVYANPMLLSDFRSVSILLRSGNTQAVPQGFGPWLAPVDDNAENICESLLAVGVEICGSYSGELMKFLRRSFNNPHIGNHMSHLCAFCVRLSRRSNRQRAYVQYFDDKLDLLVFDKQSLRLAASYPAATPDDALYWTLAGCETAGFSRSEGEMMLVAPPASRDKLQPLLRGYVNYVMPLIIPADLCREAPLELALAARPNSNETN